MRLRPRVRAGSRQTQLWEWVKHWPTDTLLTHEHGNTSAPNRDASLQTGPTDATKEKTTKITAFSILWGVLVGFSLQPLLSRDLILHTWPLETGNSGETPSNSAYPASSVYVSEYFYPASSESSLGDGSFMWLPTPCCANSVGRSAFKYECFI